MLTMQPELSPAHIVSNTCAGVAQIPVPTVGKHERMLIREMPFAGFYRAVVRYGYMDEVRTHTYYSHHAVKSDLL